MAVSKHNLWKRKKNGVMKLIRSHSEWLERRREMKTRKKNVPIQDSQWWEKETTHNHKTDSMLETKVGGSSTKRTQVGKKV